MTTPQYLACLRKLGVTNWGAHKVVGISPAQAMKLANGTCPPSRPVAKLLRVMLRHRVEPSEVEGL